MTESIMAFENKNIIQYNILIQVGGVCLRNVSETFHCWSSLKDLVKLDQTNELNDQEASTMSQAEPRMHS